MICAAGVVREKGLEGFEVVALDDQVAAAGVAAGEVGHVLEQAEGHLLVVIDDGFFTDPVQCGHGAKSGCCPKVLLARARA